MFELFKKKSAKEKLEEQYKKLLDEAYKLSHINRTQADKKQAEAEAILQQIEKLNS